MAGEARPASPWKGLSYGGAAAPAGSRGSSGTRGRGAKLTVNITDHVSVHALITWLILH